MTSRRVTIAARDQHGYVTRLENPTEAWSPRSSREVLLDIELGEHSYSVHWPGHTSEIYGAEDGGGIYLRTDRDASPHNDLLDLPAA